MMLSAKLPSLVGLKSPGFRPSARGLAIQNARERVRARGRGGQACADDRADAGHGGRRALSSSPAPQNNTAVARERVGRLCLPIPHNNEYPVIHAMIHKLDRRPRLLQIAAHARELTCAPTVLRLTSRRSDSIRARDHLWRPSRRATTRNPRKQSANPVREICLRLSLEETLEWSGGENAREHKPACLHHPPQP